jgi:stage II sporulation protein E
VFNKTGTLGSYGRSFSSHLFSSERQRKIYLLLRKGQAFMNLQNLFFSTAAFFLARASIFGEIAPFGIVFWLLVLRLKPAQAYTVAFFVFLGRLSAFSGLELYGLLVAMPAIWLLEGLYLRLLGRRPPLLLQALLAPFWQKVPLILFAYYSLFDLFVLSMEVAMAVLCVVLLKPVMEKPEEDRSLEQEAVIAVIILTGLLLLGTKGIILPAGITLRGLLAKAILLGGAYLFGASWGASAALLIGLLIMVTDFATPGFILASITAAFLAGLVHKYGRLLTSAFFLFGSWCFYCLNFETGNFVAAEDFLVVLVFLLLPAAFLNRVRQEKRKLSFFSLPEEEGLRRLVAQRIKDFSRIFKELGEAFSYTFQNEQIVSSTDISPLLNSLAEKVCQGCLFKRRCWETEFYKNYNVMLELFTRLESEGRISEGHIPKELRERCTRSKELVRAAEELRDIYHLNRYWQAQFKEGRQLVSSQLNGISAVMNDLAQEIKLELVEGEENVAAPKYLLEVGISQAVCKGKRASGDYYSIMELKDGKQVIILSDGMGSGMRAQQESKATVSIIEKLLEAGFERDIILRTVNSLLQLRSSDEIFATVDLLLFDSICGQFELLKIGAAPSYLKKREKIKELGANSLPMGILHQIEAESLHEVVEDGDLLLLFTDGLLETISIDGGGGQEWLLGFLRQVDESTHAQFVADRLLDAVSAQPEDDITVIVCRVRKLF